MILNALGIQYHDGQLLVLDQQALPEKEIWLECHSIDDMCMMIKALKVRGAPLIGIAALLALMQYVKQGATVDQIKKAVEILIATRPTAVNLKNYMQILLAALKDDPAVVLEVGQTLFLEDVALCDQMAIHGAALIPQGANVLTCCNTGGLATVGTGTALGVIKQAYTQGKVKQVYPCETRPLLQGGRLTTWELEKAEIPYTLICDNMAAFLMQQGKVDIIFVGADRIVANGDVANKIGTYSLAVLAQYHKIPFYVVAPHTTLDKTCPSGKEIEIEIRSPEEVKGALGRITWTPPHAQVYNPSFDVTPAALITGYVLDTGVMREITFPRE